MSLRQRGIEATVRISVDGETQVGSFIKVKNLTITPRSEIVEEEYLGEDVSDLDFRHDGWDFAFEVDDQDARCIRFLDSIVSREEQHTRHPEITVTVLNRYREPGERAVAEVLYDAKLRVGERGFGGRKEYVGTKFEGKAKKKLTITQ